MPKKNNFIDNFMMTGQLISFLLVLILYPYLWMIWLFSEDKSFTPNDLIKERWNDLNANNK